jgi:hypothetical protein
MVATTPHNRAMTAEAHRRLYGKTFRLFVLGAGFSKPAGLPLASELLKPVRQAIRTYAPGNGLTILDDAIDEYRRFLRETEPSKQFDLEEFGAWLDWEHTLLMEGCETERHANRSGLQLRWGIGRVLHARTPEQVPAAYLDFARELDVTDLVVTLNYDCLLERALEEAGVPFRRFPGRYKSVDGILASDLDHQIELQVMKLHGSIDWTFFGSEESNAEYDLQPLAEGPRREDDPLRQVAVIPKAELDRFYSDSGSWWKHPLLLLPPSTAKPLAASPLVELWNGIGSYAAWRGGIGVIGCSLPLGDLYLRQLMYRIAREYASSVRDGIGEGPKHHMVFVDMRDEGSKAEYFDRYRFVDRELSDFLFDGFNQAAVAHFAALAP